MKKNYVYLFVLLSATIVITFFLSSIYKKEVILTSYAYDTLNMINSYEFEEYMTEHLDTIIYISDKTNLNNNKFEKKFINKLEKLNLLENTIYIEKQEITPSLEKTLKENYSCNYNEDSLPVIIVINDNQIIQTSIVDENSDVNTIIDYEVFE